MTQTNPAPQAVEQAEAALPGTVMQMITGYWVSQAIYVLAKLGIADLLKDGPKSAEELSPVVAANQDYLYRVMRALASVQVLDERPEGVFALTPISELLRSDHPHSLRAVAIMVGEEHYVAWGRLKEAMLTGGSPFESVYGMPVFEYFQQNPEAGQTFNAAMRSLSSNEHVAIVPAYDFGRFNTLVDVGGGTGTLLSRILEHYPNIRGTLFDLPHVVDAARQEMGPANPLNDRLEVMGGSFFEQVPEGRDAYLVAHILHDWDDERATKILHAIQRAMRMDSVLLISECVIEPGNAAPRAKFMDLNMLVMTPGGRERTATEFAALLDGAGLALNRIVPTDSVVSLIEAIKK